MPKPRAEPKKEYFQGIKRVADQTFKKTYFPREWQSQFDISQEILAWDFDGDERDRLPYVGKPARCKDCDTPSGALHLLGCP